MLSLNNILFANNSLAAGSFELYFKVFSPIDLQTIIQVQASYTICAKADCDRSKAGWDSAQSGEDICGPGL